MPKQCGWLVLGLLAAMSPGACANDLVCASGTRAKGNRCVTDIIECGPGMVLQGDACVTIDYTCGAGTHLVDGACVPEAGACAPGTHLEGTTCVADGLLPPEIGESTNEDPAPFSLPAVGETIVLGGTVDFPIDVTGDGWADEDWDTFIFHAPGGTYLRLTGVAEDAARPSLIVSSSFADSDGYPYYTRYAMSADSAECERAVFLPFEDDYQIWVTDYEIFLGAVIGNHALAVGGDDFGYRVTVENLGTPQITQVTTVPRVDPGNWPEGELRFYHVPADQAKDAVVVTSVGVPATAVGSDVFNMLQIFADDAYFGEASARGIGGDAKTVLGMSSGIDYLVVMDHLITLGRRAQYEMRFVDKPARDCVTTACTGDTIAAGDFNLYRYDLTALQFLNVGLYVQDGDPQLETILINEDLTELIDDSTASSYRNAWLKQFASEPQRLYLWVQGSASAAGPFTMEQSIVTTESLIPGAAVADRPIARMPAGTLGNAGVDHLLVSAGQMVVLTGFAADGLVSPLQDIVSRNILRLGPAMNPRIADGAAARVTPLIAPIAEAGYYLHLVRDRDAAGAALTATYGTTTSLLTPVELSGTLEAAGTLTSGEQTLDATSRMRLFSFTGTTGMAVRITATPEAASSLSPRLMVLVPGQIWESDTDWSFYASASGPRLGLAHSATAEAAAPVSVTHTLLAGPSYLALENVGDPAGDTATFELTVVTEAAPANQACATAQVVDLTSLPAEVSGTLVGASSALNLGYGNTCTGGSTGGSEVFYSVALTAGDELTVTLTPAEFFDGVLYVLADCSATPTCLAGHDVVGDESLTYTAATSGTFIVVVDSHSGDLPAEFTLTFDVGP